MPEVIIRSPNPHEMEQVFDLRWKVLRQPLGEPRGSERDEWDEQRDTIHGAAFDSGLVVATGRIHMVEEEDGLAQVRYMATHPDHRRQGHGERVLRYMERVAWFVGVSAVQLNARTEALSLYEGAGYQRTGRQLQLRGLPHIEMKKELFDTRPRW